MPVNTSNPLYQNIQSTAEEVKNLYTNQPTFMNTMQNGVVNNDATLNSNVNDYSSAVDQLFSHDKTIANANLSDPMFSAGNTGYVSDPMAREKLSADTFALEGGRVASSLNRLEKRKIFLAGLVDQAVKLYETGISGKESEADMALKLAQLEETVRSNKEDDAYKTATLAETTRSNRENESIARDKGKGTSTGVGEIDDLTDAEAVSAIKEKYGPNIQLGNNGTERGARAKDLLAKLYNGEEVDYRDLLTPADALKIDEATASLQGADRALATFNKYNSGKDQSGGTGWLTGKINEGTLLSPIFIGEKERDMRRAVIDVSSAYQKFLSGVAVSAQEMVRLEGLLPSQKKPESANVADLVRLKRGMEINLELDKIAKLNKLSPDQAYRNFGPTVFSKYGEVYPSSGTSTNGGLTEDEIKKAMGL